MTFLSSLTHDSAHKASQDNQQQLILEREFDLYAEVSETTQLFLKNLAKYILGKCKRSALTVEHKGIGSWIEN